MSRLPPKFLMKGLHLLSGPLVAPQHSLACDRSLHLGSQQLLPCVPYFLPSGIYESKFLSPCKDSSHFELNATLQCGLL